MSYHFEMLCIILAEFCRINSTGNVKTAIVEVVCGALVAFAQFKKREKHPWKTVTFSNTPLWVFFTFFKLYKCC